MDFGDILEQWDSMETKKANSKQINRDSSQNTQKANPMDIWLRRYGVQDKDANSSEQEKSTLPRGGYKNLPIEGKIDLHGLTKEEAWEALKIFINDSVAKGKRKLLIVHGKGNHRLESQNICPLAETVRLFIETDSRLGASGHPENKQGGKGATWVIIKKKKR